MMVTSMLGLFAQAIRSWKTALPVAILAAAGLALGIGSATGIYSVVEAVLLKPLPYANSDRYLIVRTEWRRSPGAWSLFSYADFLDYAQRNHTLQALGCYQTSAFNVMFHNRANHVLGTQLSSAVLPMLAIRPSRGQWFGERDEDAVLISDSLWRRLGSDPEIVGNVMIVNGVSRTVTGVMPAWFRFPADSAKNDIWVPLQPDRDQLKFRSYHYLSCLALPKPAVGESQVRADLQGILEQISREQPADAGEPEIVSILPLLPEIVRFIRPPLLSLMGSALALLLISCANVAGMLLARSVARGRETAVRVALGATTRQLAQQFLFEGLVVALVGAAAGSFVAYAVVRAILSLAAGQIPRADQISADLRVLGFSLLISILSSVFFSLAPLWQAARTEPNEVLNDGVRSSSSAANRRLLEFFVVAEIMLAFGLLAVGGVLWERFHGLYRIDPGFDAGNLLVAKVYAPFSKYSEQEHKFYFGKLLDAVSRIPGVELAGFSNMLPMVDGGNNTALQVEGRPQKPWTEVDAFTEQRFVSPSYFAALRIPLIAGRYLNDADKDGEVIALVVNQTLASSKWPNENPVGSFVRIFSWTERRFQVVGVVGDVRNYGLNDPPHPEFYMSYRAHSTQETQWAIRSKLSESALTPLVRRAVESIDPEQTIYSVQTMREAIDDTLLTDRAQSTFLAFFAGAALALSAIAVYGVVSYTVRQRTTEMGTRMALGADSHSVLRLVVGDGLRMSALGILAGCVVLLIATRLMASAQAHIQIDDGWPFLVAALAIGFVTFAASWFPAWRAAALPPMIAIRNDLGSSWQESKLHYRHLFERATGPGVADHLGVEQATLLSNMVAAGRNSESFHQAITAALNVICEKLRLEKIVLLAQFAPDQPLHLLDDSQVSIPLDAFLVRRLKRLTSPLTLSQAEFDAWEHWALANSPGRLAEIATLRRIDPSLALPVLSKNDVIGVLLLGKPSQGTYSPEALESLPPAASQLGLMLENSRLTNRIVDQERLRREVLLATEVQKRLFPQSWPQTASIQLAGVCMPARGVGGDYYDFLDLGNNQIGVALADVAGKGIAAALIMSIVQASLRSLTDMRNSSLAELAGKMNRLLHRSTGSSSYATFFYAQVDEPKQELRYVNAGHNPPMLFRGPSWNVGHVPFVASAATVEELAVGGTIIGMFAQAAYEEARIELRPGDVLMLFSDGVSEAHNPAEEEFGEDRLKDLLRKVSHLPVNDMAAAVMQELKQWMLDAPQHDDLTFVLMKVA